MVIQLEISDSELAKKAGVTRQYLQKLRKEGRLHIWLQFWLHTKKCKLLNISEKEDALVAYSVASLVASKEEEKVTKEKEENLKENIIINNIKESPLPQPRPPRVDDLSQYEWADDAIREVLQEWLNYKRKIGQTYKTELGLKKLHTQLLRWSDGSPTKAQAIIDQSMVNNWQGLFELKGEKKQEVGVILSDQPKTEKDYGFDW